MTKRKSRKTIRERKGAIKPWRAMYDGTCRPCRGQIEQGQLVCRFENRVIHYTCHPDWRPAPFPGYDYSGHRTEDDNGQENT